MDILTIVATVVVAITIYVVVTKFLLGKKKPDPVKWDTEWGADIGAKKGGKSGGKEEEEEGGVDLKIYFGSQTGTAEDFANTLSDEARAYGFKPDVVDLEELEPDELTDVKFALFCMATYGEGEPTDNARAFNDWLQEEHEGLLEGLSFAVFGLGNSTYELYNSQGKRTDKELEVKGGTRMYDLGLGDDDQSLEEDFEKWKGNLWQNVCEAAGLDFSEAREVKKQRRYVLHDYEKPPKTLTSHHFQVPAEVEQAGEHLVASERLIKANHKSYKMYDSKNPFLGRIVQMRELHGPSSDRSCLHVELELIKNTYLRYQPGDHVGIYAENNREVVEHLARRLGVDLDRVVKLGPAENSRASPMGPFTVRRALTSYADICARPRQSLLKDMSQFATDEDERARLAMLGDASNDATVAEYKKYIWEDFRNVVDVLDEFPSLQPPLDVFLETVPRLDPRFYSISSAMDVASDRVSITAVVVRVPKKGGEIKVHQGVATTWIADMHDRVGNVILPCFIRKSEFKLPKDPSCPIVMIGPGTGIAPFRGFLQWRSHHMKTKDLGPAVLFFGCRRSDTDYLYKDELEQAVQEGYLTELITAFSRETEEKVYVQHRLEEHAVMIYEQYIAKGGHIYVCGDATYMARDVHKCVRNVIAKCEGLDEDAAEQRIQELRKSHRYQEDIWHSS